MREKNGEDEYFCDGVLSLRYRSPLGPCAAGVVVWMVLSMLLLFLPSCAGECNILCSLLACTHRQSRNRVDDPILYRVLCTTMVSCNVFRTMYAVIGFTAAAIMHRVLSIALDQESQKS